MLLAGDLGGTKTLLGLFQTIGLGAADGSARARVPDARYAGADEILRAFLDAADVAAADIEAASPRVARPGDRSALQADQRRLARRCARADVAGSAWRG